MYDFINAVYKSVYAMVGGDRLPGAMLGATSKTFLWENTLLSCEILCSTCVTIKPKTSGSVRAKSLLHF